MKNYLLLSILLILIHSSMAQQIPQRQWHHFYGGSQFELFDGAFAATPDGGCIFIANTGSNDGDLKGHQNPKRSDEKRDNWIVKLNAQGDTVWTFTINDKNRFAGMNLLQSIKVIPGGGYIAVGVGLTDPASVASVRARMVRISEDGKVIWDKGFLTNRPQSSLNLDNRFFDVVVTDEGEYIVSGSCRSELVGVPAEQTDDVWLVKINANGEKLLEHIYQIPGSELPTSIHRIPTGGWIITMNNSRVIGGKKTSGTMILKTNTNGELEPGWPLAMEKAGCSLWANTRSILGPDNSLLITEKWNCAPNMITRVTKLSLSQEIIWQKEFLSTNNDGEVNSIEVFPDNTILLGRFSEITIDACKQQVIYKLNPQGDILFKLPIGPISVKAIKRNEQGGFFLLSTSDSNPNCFPDLPSNRKNDIYVAKFCPDFELETEGLSTFCTGTTTILKTKFVTDATYQWLKNGQLIVGAVSPSLTVAEAGSYAVVVKLGNCTVTTPARTITVKPLPEAIVTAPDLTEVCEGVPVELNANAGEGLTYQWKKEGVTIAGAVGRVFQPKVTGSYSVAVFKETCSKESATVSVQFKPTPLAMATSNSPVGWLCTIKLAAQPAGLDYHWEGPKGYISSQQNPKRCLTTPRKMGIYTLTVTDPMSKCSAKATVEVKHKSEMK